MVIKEVKPRKDQPDDLIHNAGQKPKAQDLWAALLFIAVTGAFIGLSIYTYSTADWTLLTNPNQGSNKTKRADGNNDLGNPFSAAGISSIIVSFIVAVLFTFMYLKFMQHSPEKLIKVSFWLYFVFLILMTIFMFATGNFIGGIFGVISIVFTVFMWYGIRSQIPFLSALLSTVAKVTRKYPAMITTVFIGDFASLIWSAFSAGAFMSFAVRFAIRDINGDGKVDFDNRNPAFIICVIFGLFSSYWVMNVLKYLIHVCICGVYATYYFLSDNMPSSPTMASIKRACTTSFGSVCFGALVITIVQLIRTAISYARSQTNSTIAYFILCCLQCIVSCFEGLLDFFNYYAFTQVAIYGKDYCTAAKDTWNLLKQRGLDVIINEILIDRVIACGSIFVAVLCCCIPLIIYAIAQDYNGPWFILWAIASALMGLFIFQNVGTVINVFFIYLGWNCYNFCLFS